MSFLFLLSSLYSMNLWAETCLEQYQKDPERFKSEIALMEELEPYRSKDLLEISEEVLNSIANFPNSKSLYISYCKSLTKLMNTPLVCKKYEPKEFIITLILHNKNNTFCQNPGLFPNIISPKITLMTLNQIRDEVFIVHSDFVSLLKDSFLEYLHEKSHFTDKLVNWDNFEIGLSDNVLSSFIKTVKDQLLNNPEPTVLFKIGNEKFYVPYSTLGPESVPSVLFKNNPEERMYPLDAKYRSALVDILSYFNFDQKTRIIRFKSIVDAMEQRIRQGSALIYIVDNPSKDDRAFCVGRSDLTIAQMNNPTLLKEKAKYTSDQIYILRRQLELVQNLNLGPLFFDNYDTSGSMIHDLLKQISTIQHEINQKILKNNSDETDEKI